MFAIRFAANNRIANRFAADRFAPVLTTKTYEVSPLQSINGMKNGFLQLDKIQCLRPVILELDWLLPGKYFREWTSLRFFANSYLVFEFFFLNSDFRNGISKVSKQQS